MANVAALKKKAAEYEQRKQLDKAIAAYREVLDAYDAGGEENIDVSLYNRVGDLLMRRGNTPDAVTLFERAVDLYAEGGFFNNAIALCNKVLRTSPGRASVYYKLGKISAAKGFKGDAKQNFLEYADRMQKAGQMEEAFRALKEFADLCPDQDDIRLMLAEQLTKAERKSEALEQLQLLHARYGSEGRTAEASATFERMKAIDPSVQVKSVEAGAKAKEADDSLVFIDLNAPPEPRRTRRTQQVLSVEPPPPPPPPPPPEPVPPQPPVHPALDVVHTSQPEEAAPPAAAPALLGLEPTSIDDGHIAEPAPLPPSEFAEIDLSSIPEAAPSHVRASARDLALPGDLPLLDMGEPPVRRSVEVEARDTATPSEGLIDLPFVEAEPAASSVDLPMIDIESAAESAVLPGLEPEPAPSPALDLTPLGAEPTRAAAELPLMEIEAAAVDERVTGPAPASAELPMIDLSSAAEMAETTSEPPALAGARAEEVEELAAAAPAAPTEFGNLTPDHIEALPPPVRRTTSMLANSLGVLRVRLEDEPENWALRRTFAEALLDDGDREGGLRELEAALVGFEKMDDLDVARSIADEIIRLNPASVRHHQKRVEYAYRSNDKPRLAEAYRELADALFRDGQGERAKVVYQRVLELVPDDARAASALQAFGADVASAGAASPPASAAPAAPTAARPAQKGRRYTAQLDASAIPPVEPAPAAKGGDDDFVSLGDWLRDEEEPKSTRMVVGEEEPSGDEQADFADMLKKFKQGVSENVEEEDYESHYDLGVAYKEMGLVDEAIAEFQKALRSTTNRVRTYEALGQCFLEKKQFPVATTILQRALNEPGVGDEQLVGVLYLLGYVSEALGKRGDAKGYYERVFSVDIQFRDVGERLNAVDKAMQ